MITHKITRKFGLGQLAIERVISIEGGAGLNLDETIDTTANRLVAFTADVSQLKSLFIVSNKDVTIKTNSSGSPANTFTLSANIPFSFILGDPPLRDTNGDAVTTDITALYVTMQAEGLLQIRALIDPTV